MKRIILFLLICSMAFPSIAIAKFPDVDDNTASWAGEAIDYLTGEDIINGYEDGSFRPDGNVTRAELAKLLSESFGVKSGNAEFNDIANHWAEGYIKDMAQFMYTSGTEFQPDIPATREFIVYSVINSLGLKAKNDDSIKSFVDYTDISEDARLQFASAVNVGVIKGYEDGSVRPSAYVSRAEVAVLMYRAIIVKKVIDSSEVPDDTDNSVTPDKPSVPDKPEVPDNPVNPPADENPADETEHLYTLYPGKDLILVTSVSKTATDAGEDAYKIHYRLSDSEDLYSATVPYDTKVGGVRSDISDIQGGDVLIMDTAFHGSIGCLYVLASYSGSTPHFAELTEYTRGEDYTFYSGKLVSMELNTKSVTLNLSTEGATNDVVVLKTANVNIYTPWKNADKWTLDDIGAIDGDSENYYVFIRYTNGRATDVVINGER